MFIRTIAHPLASILLLLVSSCLFGDGVIRAASAEGEIGFIEDFALAPDRGKALEKLIPGTEDDYYYSALHAQNSGRLAEVDELLKPWIKQFGRTPRVIEIENRQALLRYDEQPRETLDYLRRRLGLQFNHRKDEAARNAELSTQLDPGLISDETLRARALQWHQGTLQGFETRALESLVHADLDARRRRDLLRRLTRPDVENLVQLIVADLKERDSGSFGYLPIHNALLQSQLDELARLMPAVADQANYVNNYLLRLLPSDDVDISADRIEREAYLNRLESFTSGLSDAHRALKAHVLYRRLEHDRALGIYDRGRFLRYLQLPRSVSYMSSEYMRRQRSGPTVGLQENFRPYSPFPPIGTDEELVRDYLSHFFVDDSDYDDFSPYVNDTWLRELFAETKIVNGLGDMETWYAWLPPARYQALRERVDLEFLPSNATHFQAGEAVGLDVAVKNVDNLIVKVFEINTPNLYRNTLSEVGTDINLDGLVAHSERLYEYDAPPLRRIVRHFDFPKLSTRGVYVVELIGNGVSSRALVRKGQLHHVQRLSSAGHVFTVLNDRNELVHSARLWLDGHEYKADGDGRITVPFTQEPGRRPVVLIDGDFASLEHFDHQEEQYILDAAFYVDREALLKGERATVIVRPSLQVHETPVTLSVIESPRLTVTTTDLDGVSSTLEASDFKLFEDRDSTFKFQVPERTVSVAFLLKGEVESLVTGKKMNIGDFEEFHLNAIDSTPHTDALVLEHADGRYRLFDLGKTGETRAGRRIQVAVKHRDYTDLVHVSLQTDAQGSVDLGALRNIESVTAEGPNNVSRTWALLDGQARYPEVLHAGVGDVIAVPYLGAATRPLREELSLIELRGPSFVRDRFEAVSLEEGYIKVSGVPAGDYSLRLKDENHTLRIRITRGAKEAGFFQSDHRLLEAAPAPPVQIDSVEALDGIVRIYLRNAGSATRTHVFATRYVPAYSLFNHLNDFDIAGLRHSTLPAVESLYVSGRNIGEEYRYILDRKYAGKHPGNMLQRPGLLLNPWAIRETQTGRQDAEEGAEWDRMMQESARRDGADGKGDGPEPVVPAMSHPNLDFLKNPTVAFLNLEADESGVIEIDRRALADKTSIHIVAVSPGQTVVRHHSLDKAPETKIDDLRLADPIDPDGHFTEQKNVTPLDGGESLLIEDITTSKIEVYDSLAKAYRLLLTISDDATLREFAFIHEWPSLSEEEKRATYSEYASHELSFFLHEKDPDFFESVILPYLQHKKDKTFLDRWLVGGDLTEYLDPWAWNRLNAVERILLARRIEEEREPTLRHLRDRDDLTPPDLARLDRLFETALKGSALETRDTFGLEDRVAELEAMAESSARGGRAVADDRRASGEALRRQLAQAPQTMAEPSMDMAAPQVAMKAGAVPEEAAEAFYDRDEARRRDVRQFYRPVDKTKEWAENNYYHLPIDRQLADLVPINPFWVDYAGHRGDTPFLSEHLAETANNFTEMMFALAVIDLPFEASESESRFEDRQFELTAGAPLLAWHKQVRPAEIDRDALPILVTQNFFRLDDRYVFDGSERRDKFVVGEFLTHVVYGCQVVVTNPTSTPSKLTVLLQIPEGAVPVLSGHFTRTRPIDLQPFSTQTFEYHFYFPFEGDFAHYPVHVARREQVVAAADPVRLQAVRTLSTVDRTSWEYISQNGSEDEVIEYLKAHNLGRIDLERIAWRMQDAAFFRRVTDLLESRHHYDNTLWSYGIRHNVPAVAREFLKHQDEFVARTGAWLESPLLDIDPVERHAYEHLEYDPLINPRAHQLGRDRRILNDRFHAQYLRFLSVLAYHPELTQEDRLALTYYLLLQDRVDEAMEQFARIERSELPTAMQYDYVAAYLHFYRAEPGSARTIAVRYADHPVDKWRKRFDAVVAQADEIEGAASAVVDPENRDQTQTQLARTEPNFELRVEAGEIQLHYTNIESCTVNFYRMDVELLFSRNPFTQEYASQFSSIRPNETLEVDLPDDADRQTIAIPEALQSKNLMIEVVAAGQTRAAPYYSGALVVQMIENYGQVSVQAEAGGKPLPGVYVKAYARMKNGEVRFYKDGYTDLRGRFDYASLSTSDLENVERFALLILSDDLGAEVREAAPPKR